MKSQWLFLKCFFLAGTVLLSACESLPGGLDQSEATLSASATVDAAASEAQAVSATLAIQHIVDISGCWRPVGSSLVYSDGASFTIFAIANNMFIIGKDAHTRFVVSENFSFIEENRDPDKPYYPPGYVHSTGAVSKDGLAISRKIVGQSGSKEYRRCANVQQAPPELRNPDNTVDPNVAEDNSGATPSPKGTIAPLSSFLKPSSPPPAKESPKPPPEPTPEASAP